LQRQDVLAVLPFATPVDLSDGQLMQSVPEDLPVFAEYLSTSQLLQDLKPLPS